MSQLVVCIRVIRMTADNILKLSNPLLSLTVLRKRFCQSDPDWNVIRFRFFVLLELFYLTAECKCARPEFKVDLAIRKVNMTLKRN